MGIDSLNYNNYQQVASAYGKSVNPFIKEGYHQGRTEQGVPNTTPQVQPSFKPTVDQYELANKIAEGKIDLTKVKTNPFVQPTTVAKEIDNAKNFFGKNNGTGELQPESRNEILGQKLWTKA